MGHRQLIGARWRLSIGPLEGAFVYRGEKKVRVHKISWGATWKNFKFMPIFYLSPNKHFSRLVKSHVGLHEIESPNKIGGIDPWREG